jgi:hypothetical protein
MANVMRFQAGGAVQETAFYVPRAADGELLKALSEGVFCHVLATTQTGKSSLRVRVARALEERGAQTAEIILTDVASERTSEEQWYHDLGWTLARKAGFADVFDAFWKEHAALVPMHRWSRLLREALVPRLERPLVVFLDEINVVLSLSFPADPFFASLRELYDARATDGALGKITFCLLGIATAEGLMKNPAMAPFRNGRRVVLDDFTRAEMDTLLPGLAGAGKDAAGVRRAGSWRRGELTGSSGAAGGGRSVPRPEAGDGCEPAVRGVVPRSGRGNHAGDGYGLPVPAALGRRADRLGPR